MRRGTRVGQAYIALTADGSGINKDIEDSMDDVDFAAIGDEHGQDYEDNLRAHLGGVSESFDKFLRDLGKSIDTDDSLTTGIRRQVNDAFTGGDLDSLTAGIGRRLGISLGSEMQPEIERAIRVSVNDSLQSLGRTSNFDMSDFIRSVNSGNGGISIIGPIMDRAENEARTSMERQAREMISVHTEALQENAEHDRAALRDRERMYADMFIRIEDRETESSRVYENLLRGEEAAHARSITERAQFEEDYNRRRNRDQEAYAADFARLLDEQDARQARSFRSRYAAARSSQSDAGGIGNLFGEGSRNNFLNFVGKTIGNITGLVSKAQSAVTGLFSTFQEGFQSAADGASNFTRIGAGMGSVLTEIGVTAAVALPAIAIGAVIAVAAMSVLVSVASALLAIVVALASTIASALVGAALVGAGALGALGVAAGLVAVAFTSLTDAQKASLKADFAPLKQELTGLGQLMLTDLIPHFSTWSSNLQTALYQLTPLASVFGNAIGQAGDRLTASLSGPGFTFLTQQLGIYLPGIITRLSAALGNFLNGIAATFGVLLPSVSRFATYLVDVSTRFSNFTASAEGQNKIADFIDRAIDSVKSFSGFVREATGFITDLLFNTNSQTAGNTIFDSLRDSFAGFREDLKGDDLKNWFDRALEFGSDVKDLIIEIKDTIKKLDSDGTLEDVGDAFQDIADVLQTVTDTAGVTVDILETLWDLIFHPDQAASSLFTKIKTEISGVNSDLDGVIGKVNLISAGAFGNIAKQAQSFTPGYQYGAPIGPGLGSTATLPSQQGLTDAGKAALDATSVSNGGYKPDPVKKEPKYVNPYIAYANQIINSAPTAAQAMLTALKKMNGAVADAIKASTTASGGDAVKSALDSQVDSMRNAGRSAVDAARSSLTSAAESLASAASAKAAKAALRNVKQSKAELKEAKAQQAKINASAAIVQAQKVINQGNVAALVAGLGAQNATLADYAEARVIVADRLATANQKLADAISLRDSYNQSVIDGVKAFGSILSAQAQTINGVQQALTATDIVSTMSDRLDQIRKFQSDLNILLSQGLSNDAYKQLVDAGVEQGGAYADALVKGGAGAVADVNYLTGQIAGVAESLGSQASTRLYQAGVDAAQGLVDGLLSLSGQLDSAAAALGDSIANAVKRALGIASPSKVLRGMMGYVGDGAVLGLDDQTAKLEQAANRLSSKVRIQPSVEVAGYAAAQNRGTGVSENQGGDSTTHVWQITTPTTDPLGVAREAINEMTGRL